MRYGLLMAMVLITSIMLAGAIGKLSGLTAAHHSFADLGLPPWFGYMIGLCELAGAVGLWFHQTSRLAAMGVATIMVGAIYYHLSYPPLPAGLPALLVLLCSVWIVSNGGNGIWHLPLRRRA